MQSEPIGVFTTAYPEGKRFLPDFFSSLSMQQDCDFELWVGLDRIPKKELKAYDNADHAIKYIERKKDESNISLRQRAIEKMINAYQSIIFVDSDDILAPSRVSAARASMKSYDVYGCAMKIIDEEGNDLGITFQKPQNASIDSILPRFNILGFTNSCYSTESLEKCFPFPQDCILLDWFVATRAWSMDARMVFDPAQRMSYRQHSSNTACVIPPFTHEQVLKSTNLVLQHYDLVLRNIPELPDSKRIFIATAQKYVESFYSSIANSSEVFQEYIRKLNQLPPNHLWWSCVAHPDLEAVWKH